MDKRINVRFFDKNLKFIGELDAYEGLEFITRWTKYGTFQIFVYRITKQMKIGNYIMLDNDRKKTGIIKRIECSDDDNSSTPATISGYTLLHLLTQRITYPPKGLAYHSFHDTAENIICSLVKANATNATDTKRNIPFLKVKASSGRGDRVYYQTRYDNLDEAVTALCEASGLGVSISLIPENQQLLFEVLEGVDRSANQSNRPPMIFNVDYDNVTNREFISDISEYKNTAIVAGQGEGAERRIRYVGNENSGLERYELFVDARDIEDDTALPDRGKSKLAECACNDTYSSEVDSSQYKIKWDIGDIVVTVDREYAVNMNERIVETTETFDENGYSISPTFGTTQKTILEKISDISTTSMQLVEGIQGIKGEDGKTPQVMINTDGHLIAIYED